MDISFSRSGRCGPPQGCQGVLGDSLPLSVPTDHRLGMLLSEAAGSDMSLSSVLTVLEEEGLKDGVSSLEAFSPGW